MRKPRGWARRLGEVFYDPKMNAFVQLRGVRRGFAILSGFRGYFSDAQISNGSQQLSYLYLSQLKPVYGLDQMKEAEYDGIGWRIKGYHPIHNPIPCRRAPETTTA